MKRTIFAIATFVVQSAVSHCSAQSDEVTFDLITNNNGNLLGKITAITQDRYGYMWFAGQDARCLYRFDGYRFTSFKHDSLNKNSPGGTNLETVYADPSGIIWIGYYTAGLDEFNPVTHQFRHFGYSVNDPQSLSNDSVTQVLRDKQGRIWVGTQNGLNLLNEKDGTFKRYHKIQGDRTSLSSDVVRAIYQDHEGTLWIGTGYPFDPTKPEDGGLNRFETDGTFKQFLHDPNNSHSLLNNKVRALFEDSQGNFWIGTGKNGLHIMNRKNGSFERFVYDPANPGKLSGPEYNPNLSFDHITFIAEDGSGAIWMGTYASGITRYDPKNKRVTHFISNNGFPDRTGWSAFTSNDGVLWISTQEPNLFRMNPFAASVAKTSAGNPVQCFYEDENKMLWAGTMERGLFQFDQDKKLLHTFGPGFIHSIVPEGKDTFLLGTGDRVAVFNRKTKSFEPFGIHDETYSILKDKDGFTWFATAHSGLLRFNSKDKSLVNYFPSSGGNSLPEIVSLLQDRSGFIWAGTVFKGVYRLDMSSGKIVHYLNGLAVGCLYQSSDEAILAGTSNGLYRYNKTTNDFSHVFDLQSDVSRNAIVSIMEDDFKNLWIATRLNIVRFDPQKKQTSIYGKQYDISPNTLTYGIYKNTKGEILVGNNRGFYTFQPDQLSVSRARSKIIVTDFYVNNTLAENGEKGILQKPVEETDTIELKYDQNHLTFNFALVDYRAPDENNIFTKLDAFDTIWRKASGENSADYFNVPPGHYRFQLKAFNSDGMMSEKSVSVIINPPWWRTWWAYTFYVICLIAASIVANRIIRHRIMEKERIKNREKELVHAREIEKAYNELKATQSQLIQSEKMASLGELTAGIAHEIQNPLNFVNNFSEVNNELIEELKSQKSKLKSEEQDEILDNIKENNEKIVTHGKRADAIVKGMLQHSRTSTGQKELTDISALCDEYLRLAYHGLRAKDKSFNVEIKTDFDSSIGKINIIPQDIGRVLLNLINNAFYAVNEKATSCKLLAVSYEPRVSVKTRRIGEKVLISVSDNGGGIADSIKEKIFQPFFTTKPTGQGTGLGLSLAYDIVKAHGGEIKVQTTGSEGSTFIIQLPANAS